MNPLAIVILSGALVVASGVGAAVAFGADSEPDVTISPITLQPQAPADSSTPGPSTTAEPDTSSPVPVQPSAPHDLGDDHGGDDSSDDNSGHGGGDDSGSDDSGGHGSDDN